MEINIHIFGAIAGALTTICFIPQAWKVITTRHTEGISVLMYAIFTVGVFFWLVYGYFLNSLPMIIANVITFVLAFTIFVIVVRNRN